MNESYKVVFKGGSGEIVEKKSRFIANVYPVETADEAEEIIGKLKKQYWDARHNCYAYIVGDDMQTRRCSDDGEPQGTAGRPMLDILSGERLCNVLVVVTRYFGGVLLGTGGLIRAYQAAVREGLYASDIIEKKSAYKYTITVDYTFMGKIQYTAQSLGVITLDTVYGDKVIFIMLVQTENEKAFCEKLMEATSAQAVLKKECTVWYGISEDGNVHILSESEEGFDKGDE